ncbi:hypothetical protein AVEN_159070-1 [Araneus ventricosus]|uniref:Uncharacterized protein n=1 Tax=Araneus ventricosus TaxID=182803 RepID=A0A4Y2B8W9_ARAVE|nr:hypothetical protein AVEN_159070-1 [Araneus ventricosus]
MIFIYLEEWNFFVEAIDYATNLPQQPITILVDNQASALTEANLESGNTIARIICRNLIQVSWIKAHVGYDGNKEAYRLVKEAAESNIEQYQTQVPKCHLKSSLKQKIMQEWQKN